MPHDAGHRSPVDGGLTRTIPAHRLTMIDDVSSDRFEETAFSLTFTWMPATARVAAGEPEVRTTRAYPHAG